MTALQWGDVDFDAEQITIRRAWSDGGKGVGMVSRSSAKRSSAAGGMINAERLPGSRPSETSSAGSRSGSGRV